MDTGATGTSRQSATINVTPLIDVLLVLLIIFMVIEPEIARGLAASAPQPNSHGDSLETQTVMLTVRRVGESASYAIDGRNVAASDLLATLQTSFQSRRHTTIFIDGDALLQFSEVATALDAAQASGAETIGFVTPRLLAGH